MKRIVITAAITLAVISGCAASDPADAEPGVASASSDTGTFRSPSDSTAVSRTGGGEDSPEPSPSSASASRGHLAVTTLTGDTFDAAATQGQPLILWFWAPWCTICRAEAPDVIEVVAELKESGSPVTVIGVPGRGEVPEMEDFVADTGTGVLTHLVDADGTLWREYGVVYQPAFALLSPDGEVEVINGALGVDGLREAAARVAEG